MIRFDEDAFGTPLAPLTCSLTSLFGGSGHTTATAENQPWSGQTPYLQQAFGAAGNLFNNYTPQYYPGSGVAPMTDAQNSGLTGVINKASSPDGIASSVGDFTKNLVGGQYLNSNPYNDPTAKSILSQVIPNVEAQFVHGNSMHNPSAAYATAQGAASALAPYQFGAYQQGINNMIQGAQLAPGAEQLSYFAPNQLINAGEYQQNQGQQNINAEKAKWDYYQNLPFDQLSKFMSTITGNYGGTSTQRDPYSINPAAATGSLFGGLSQLFGGSGGLGGLFGGSGGGLGGGLGSLAGAFGKGGG